MCNSPAISTQSCLLIVQQMATSRQHICEAYKEFLRHQTEIRSFSYGYSYAFNMATLQPGSNAYDFLNNWTGSCLIMIMMRPDTYLPETCYQPIQPFIDPRAHNLCDALLNWGTQHQRSGQGPNNLPTNILEGILCNLGEKDSVKLRQAWRNTLVQALRLDEYQLRTITQNEFITHMIADDNPVYDSFEEQCAMNLCVMCKNDPKDFWLHFKEAIEVLYSYAGEDCVDLEIIAKSLTHETYMKDISGLTEDEAKIVQSAMVRYASIRAWW